MHLTAWRRPSVRVRRHLALRAFAEQHGWSVLGMVTDLSTRYPVPDLVGAPRAQAELAVHGRWRGWPATAALALARPGGGSVSRGVDTAVLLVAVDGGPRGTQMAAAVTAGAPEVASLGRGRVPPGVAGLLAAAPGPDGPGHGGRLRPGDHVVLGEVDLVLARRLARREAGPDPAVLLDVLVELLDATDV